LKQHSVRLPVGQSGESRQVRPTPRPTVDLTAAPAVLTIEPVMWILPMKRRSTNASMVFFVGTFVVSFPV
jgi:hypothetical protein